MPRSCPVAANTAAIARRGREGDRLHARGDGAVRARPGERLEVGGGRVQHPLDPLVGEERLGDHRLAVARVEVLVRRLLVAAHVRLEDRPLGLRRGALHHVAHVEGVGVAGHHVRPDGVAGRPGPEGVAHRADDVRLAPRAGGRGGRASGRRSRSSQSLHRRAARASIQRASAIACGRVGADEARGAGDPVGEHVGADRPGRGRAAGHRERQAALGVGERDVDGLLGCGRSRRRAPLVGELVVAELDRDRADRDRDAPRRRSAPRPRRRTARGRPR